MIKALLLFSGGLDSILSAKILKDQGIKVDPVCFCSYFFDCKLASKSAKENGLKLRIVDISKEHLKTVKTPKHGRGTALNPCIDCHLLMLKTAKRIIKQEGHDFIATGEVLGQRPFSQNINALKLIEQRAGLRGMILRPLSAKLLDKTIAEKKGWVKRDELYNILGRSRRRQIELTKKFKVKYFPMPGGGCILTDKNYSNNLAKLLEKKNIDANDCYILRLGRVFFEKGGLIIVARNEVESKELEKTRKKSDLVLAPVDFTGPTVLIRKIKKPSLKEMVLIGKELLLKYSKKAGEIKILPPLKS